MNKCSLLMLLSAAVGCATVPKADRDPFAAIKEDNASEVERLVATGAKSPPPAGVSGQHRSSSAQAPFGVILLIVLAVSSISCRHHGDPASPVLLFDGTGTSNGDVAAIESVLAESGLAYDTAGSWRLDRMSEAELLFLPTPTPIGSVCCL